MAESEGLVLRDMDRHSESLPVLRHALELLPNNQSCHQEAAARIYFSIAQSSLAINLPNEVNKALHEAQQLGHNLGLILNVKGLLARSLNDQTLALKYLSKSIRRKPNEARYLNILSG